MQQLQVGEVHIRDEGDRRDDEAEGEEGDGRRSEEAGTEGDDHSEAVEVHGAHEHPWAAEDLVGLAEDRGVQVVGHTPDASEDGVHRELLRHRPSCRLLRWSIPCHHQRQNLHQPQQNY